MAHAGFLLQGYRAKGIPTRWDWLPAGPIYHCARIQCSESTSASFHMHTPVCIHTRVLVFMRDVRIGMAWVDIVMHMWMLSTAHSLDINWSNFGLFEPSKGGIQPGYLDSNIYKPLAPPQTIIHHPQILSIPLSHKILLQNLLTVYKPALFKYGTIPGVPWKFEIECSVIHEICTYC